MIENKEKSFPKLTLDELYYLEKHYQEILSYQQSNKIKSVQEATKIYISKNTIEGYL
jgi:hypothetical protein